MTRDRGAAKARRSRLAVGVVGFPARSRHSDASAGRRMPDLDCGGTRLYEHMRDGRFLLVTRDAGALDCPATVRRVRCPGLPGPAMALVRPDGYVAWAGDRGLPAALAEWCGEPVKEGRPS